MAEAVENTLQEPIYLRIRRNIMRRIERGDYVAGSAIPSENELALEFGTTRLTVRAAVDALVERGLVRRVQGKGAFVAQPLFGDEVQHGGFREYARALNAEAGVRILSCVKRPAGPYYAELFDIAPDDVLYSVRRVNSTDGEPVAVESTLIPIVRFPDIEKVDISVFSLYETYGMLGHPVALAQEKLDIEALSARDAGLLHMEQGDLALVLECVSYDTDGVPIEYARSLNRGDRGGYTYRY